MQEQVQAPSPIRKKFTELRGRNEAALVAYLTGGDPDPKSFLENSTALIEGGADILEIGIPFSDPLADGRVIQASSYRALSRGATPGNVLETVGELSRRFEQTPLVLLTYYNPILAMGLDRFILKSKQSGVSGVVVPDLPVEETSALREIASKHGIDIILIAAPNTSPSRLARIIETSAGFLYLVSLYGVTGPRENLSPQALETISRAREYSRKTLPVAVGFGITRPDHVTSAVKAGADGVIVGSAIVDVIAKHLTNSTETRDHLRRTVLQLKQATQQQPSEPSPSCSPLNQPRYP